MSASARFVIAADDKTKSAINSVVRGFKGMEGAVRGTVSRLNLAVGLLGGVGLKQLSTAILRAAEGNKAFAESMERSRKAMRDLVAGGDMARAIAAADEFTAKLSDPERAKRIQDGTDRAVSGWIRLKSAALDAALAAERYSEAFIRATPTGKQVAALFGGDEESRPLPKRGGSPFMRLRLAQAGADQARLNKAAYDTRHASVQAEFRELTKWLDDFESFEDTTKRFQAEAIRDVNDVAKETFEKNQQLIVESTDKEMEARQALYDWRRQNDEDIAREQIQAMKDVVSNTIMFWMHGSQRTAKTFLQSMLAAFADRTLQNAIDALFSLSGKKGGGFFGFLGSLFGGGRASGGPVSAGKAYVVGEHGREVFMPGQNGTILPNAGGGTVINHFSTTIDARGATSDVVKALPRILDERDKRNAEAIENRIVTKLRKGAYDRG